MAPRPVVRGRSSVDARVGNVQELSLAEREFDWAVAGWMLFHVAELDRALAEIVRVVRPYGRLATATNSEEHISESCRREIAGTSPWARVVTRVNGGEILRRHVGRVDRRDADGWITIDDEEVERGYGASLAADPADGLRPFELPRRASSFLADK